MFRTDTEPLLIRPSEFRDVRELITLDHLIWNEDTAPAAFSWRSSEEYLLHAPPGSQLVALKGGSLRGYLGFGCPTGHRCNRHVYEIYIAVHPDWQRQGVGSSLIEAMKKLAAEAGVRKLRLRALSCNVQALAFYGKCGFIEEGRLREEFYLAERYVDEVFMSYRLV